MPWHLAWIAGLALAWLCLWELLARSGALPRHVLPPFSEVLQTVFVLLESARFRGDLGATFVAIAAAFVLAAPPALLTGLLIAQYAGRTRRLSMGLNLMLGVPQSIFLPVFVLVFGVGFLEKLAFGMTHAFFVIAVTTAAAAGSVPVRLIAAARACGASDVQIFRHVYLPAMAPLVVGGLRIGLIFTMIGVLVAEMYASRDGLGRLVLMWSEMFQIANVMAVVLLVAMIAIAGNETLRLFERRAWRRESAALHL